MKFIITNIFLFIAFLLSARFFKLLDNSSYLIIWSVLGIVLLTVQAAIFCMKKGISQSIFFTIGMIVVAYFYYSKGYVGYSSFIAYGPSNKPTIQPGDEVVSRLFDFKLTKGTMVTVKLDSESYLKRIHGIPGDKVIICGVYVYVNDVTHYLENGSWVREHIDRRANCSDSNNRVSLSDDEYFLMGDNIFNSYDSRDFGAVKRADITAMHLYLFRGDNELSLSSRLE